MTFGRTYLFCALLGASLLGACSDDTGDEGGGGGLGTIDGGATGVTPIPGGAGGAQAGAAGGTQAGAAGGTLSGAAGGTLSGAAGGTLSGAAGGTLAGGTLSGASGGTHGGTASGTGGTSAGTGGTASGTGGTSAGTGGTTAGTGGTTSGTTGGPGGMAAGVGAGTCEGLPPVTDYAAKGPFDAVMEEGVGPDGNYTLFRPDATLGKDGFKHPIGAWGNGILTIPNEYAETLKLIASHGFVIIGCNDIMAERPCVNAGLDWLVQQNTMHPKMKDKLDTSREITIGYSWGGGAAIDTGNRPNVKATVSIHGMPPRETGAFTALHSPLLMLTSVGDSFVGSDQYVHPEYEDSSKVPTIYAQLQDNTLGETVDHLFIVDEGASSCVASIALGTCGSAKYQRAPAIAFLRHFACNDQGAKKFFFGSDATLCKAPWKCEKKPANAWQ